MIFFGQKSSLSETLISRLWENFTFLFVDGKFNTVFWKSDPIEHCSICGCATKGKVFTPKGQEACPKGKWTI